MTSFFAKPWTINGTILLALSIAREFPRKSERIFRATTRHSYEQGFLRLRKRLARQLNKPALLKITFHSIRHWKATIEYHKTRNLVHVMQMLGHRAVQSTLIYTHLIEFEGDEYHSAVAKTIDEAKSLIEAGFEYVCTHEDAMLFRKRK